MTKREDKLLNKLIAAAGWLTRADNKRQLGEFEKMHAAMKWANFSIDEAIEILKETRICLPLLVLLLDFWGVSFPRF